MHTLQHDTPAGTLTTIIDGSQVIRAAGFTADAQALATRLGLAEAPPAGTDGPVHQAIHAYLDGDVEALDGLHVEQPGTDFQHLVWTALRAVPPGTTATYGELAAAIGRPGATRAVGSACGRNLVAPFVPCHRAVRSDGTTGGYYYGSHVKDWLLGHESGQA
ncbi:MAG TPA: methylated-DNA--[protein]-cysteine S-methyltransferase [Euzebya sp.]|nr:methylated-DNA--[protein]-cysteine S-methyltransferase [Euzebya sp.]